MKRNILIILLNLLIVLNIIGCDSIENVSITESVDYTDIVKDNIEINNKELKDIFNNKKTFWDTDSRQNIYLKDYSSTNYMDWDNNGKYKYVRNSEKEDMKLKIARWCETDMDSDGITELLIELSGSGNILLLRNEKHIVYGYTFPFRGMKAIKEDGTFESSDSAASIYVGKLRFVGENCFYDEICVSDELNIMKPKYRIEKQESTRERVSKYLEEQKQKEEVLWNTSE